MKKGAGSRIGSYEIVTLLGAGGMGEVYRARDTRLGRDVAIKLLPESYALDRERRARFEREAQILASLNHPHIATIYGFEDSGTPALVMELVEGPTLADRIAQGPVSVREALEIGRQLILALDAAHERGIVHRDLKPANIKLGPDRAIKVLDFGLAKAVADEVSPATDLAHSPTVSVVGTMAGVILGTAAYMSPEQARGQTVDKRTDIWAFGCVMFELLTGRKAFSGSTVSDVIAAILTHEPSWADLPPDVPQSTRDLLRRCLEKDPKRRLRDIGDASLETSSAPVVRSRSVLPIGAAAIAAVVGAVVGSLSTSTRTVPNAGLSSNTTVATRLTDYGGSESAPAISPDGRAFVFISDHDGTPDLWLRQIAGGELVRLTNDPEPESEPVYAPDGESVYFSRGDADGFGIWQTGVLGGRPRRIVTGGHGPAPSPDGRQLAFLIADASNTQALAVRAVDSAEHRVLVRSLPGGVPAPSWSRDGKQLSFVRGGLFAASNLFVIDMATGNVRQVTNYTRGLEGVSSHKWLPDNRHIVVSYAPFPRQQPAADIGILDLEDGSIARLTTTVQRGLTALTVSADGTRLLAVSTENAREVWRIPADPRERPARLFGPRGDPMWTFLTRDGRLLLFNGTVSGSRNLWLGPIDNLGDARQVTFVQGDTIAHSSLSPDGSRIAFVSTATGNSDVWVQNVDGSDLRQLTNDVAADSWPVFSPDGKALVYTSLRGTQQETWTIPSTGGTAEKLFDGFFRGDWQPQPAGSGTWIVTSNGQDRVRLLDVEGRAVVWEVRVANSSLSLPMFSPDRLSFTLPFQAGRDRDTIGIFDTATGHRRTAIEMPFRVFFRANWTAQGAAFIVNRNASPSHIVLFDRFWSPR
jgi:serine/threonine protein kinase/Tol biopolymer transport system component